MKTDAPRALTDEEVRDRFMELVWSCVEYWERDSRTPDVRGKLEGLAFGIMNILDGTTVGSPSFAVVTDPHPDDEAYCRANGENWVPSGCQLPGMLHEYFFEHARKSGKL